MVMSLLLIGFGLFVCFHWKQWGEAAARRHIAYDAIWFYQLMFLLFGVAASVLGVVILVAWAATLMH
jgi:hypothetical protein